MKHVVRTRFARSHSSKPSQSSAQDGSSNHQDNHSRQWILLLIPLLIIIPLFMISSIQNKNPEDIIRNAEAKTRDLTAYVITADMTLDFVMMDAPITYYYNTTTALKNGEQYTRVEVMQAFTTASAVTEEFILKDGNYSCTNIYLTPFCIKNNEPTSPLIPDTSMNDYLGTIYVGSKKVNGRTCDALLSNINTTILNELSILNSEEIQGVKDMKSYNCIDPETGMSIESLLSMNGVTTYETIEIDVGINMTRVMKTFSTEVPENIFTLPYSIISDEEAGKIINDTMNALSQEL